MSRRTPETAFSQFVSRDISHLLVFTFSELKTLFSVFQGISDNGSFQQYFIDWSLALDHDYRRSSPANWLLEETLS